MKMICLMAAAVLLVPSTTMAETFTFSAQEMAGAVTTGTTAPDGRVVQGRYWTGTSEVTWADGKKSTEKFTCISNTQPPNDAIFMMHGTCDTSGPDGSYSSVWGCNVIDAAKMTTACVGGLYGKTGKYAKRGGTMTYHGVGPKGTGTGQISE
ncbi:MAG: hypothetical protein H2056_04600 [Sphingopyxis sp.]|nr:hypothetical protein [Sphingopyxis sp.]